MILSVNNYSHRVANSDSDKKGQNQIQESSRICAFFPQAIPGEPHHLAWGRDSKAKTGDLRPVSGVATRRCGRSNRLGGHPAEDARDLVSFRPIALTRRYIIKLGTGPAARERRQKKSIRLT